MTLASELWPRGRGRPIHPTPPFHFKDRFMPPKPLRFISLSARLAFVLLTGAAAVPAVAQCPAGVPLEGADLRGPGPLFPATNWWNLDISSAPVDTNSASYIAFINNGGTRRLHPDFGGEVSPGSVD